MSEPLEHHPDIPAAHAEVTDSKATRHTRRRYDATARIYDLLEAPAERWLYKPWRTELWKLIEGPEVLEIGVGTGKNIPYYPRGTHVTGIDLSGRMLWRARRVLAAHPEKHATLLHMDAQHPDFPEDRFNEVVATFVFCSVPDPVRGLREALRVAKPGGRLILLEHVRSPHPVAARVMTALDPIVHWITGVHIARRTVENVRRAGWDVERVVPLTGHGIFKRIVARKP